MLVVQGPAYPGPILDTDEFLRRLEELRRREDARWNEQRNSYRLLPGEDPASPYPEDAGHWSSVYRELVTFKEQVVGQVQAEQEGRSPAAAAELHNDELALRVELERLRLHLQYWEERRGGAVTEGGEGPAP